MIKLDKLKCFVVKTCTRLVHKEIISFFNRLCYYKIVNNNEISRLFQLCPRGEIGRHKGLKILAACGVPVRVWPRAPLNE